MRNTTRRGNGLRVVSTPGPLSGPIGIVRDLPPDFWHPAMGIPKEDSVGDGDEKTPPNWLTRAGATVLALCFIAIVLALTARAVDWILEGM